jgi:hypothetical protein
MSGEQRPNDREVAKILELVNSSNSVELKLTVPDTEHRSAVNNLDMDVLSAELRQIVFFDTPNLTLSKRGVVVRARRLVRGGDTVIKLRPVKPTELSRELRRSSSFTVEVDAMPGLIICSGSLKARTGNDEIKLVLQGKRAIRKLFTADQRALYREHAPKGLDLDSLTAFGPVNAARLKWVPPAFTRSMVAELWFYPDGSRILELSTKCGTHEAFQVLAELKSFLIKRGLTITRAQETKTRKALQYFSKDHKTTKSRAA